jgi:hypothetical protein
MLSNSLKILQKHIAVLEDHLVLSEKHHEMVAAVKACKLVMPPEVSGYLNLYAGGLTNEKMFNYNSVIVFLYGCYEQFIENTIREYVKCLQTLSPTLNDLSDKISGNYIKLWKSLHEHLTYPKFSNLDRDSMIQNLYESYVEKKNLLLPECFFRNNGNYRESVLSEVFKSLDVKNFTQSIRSYEPYKGVHASCRFKIDDLVNYRNEVAHTGLTENLLGEVELRELHQNVFAYAESLTSFLCDSLKEIEWRNRLRNSAELMVKKSYSIKKCVEIEDENIMVEVGCKAYVHFPKGHYPRFGEYAVQSLKVKNRLTGENEDADYILESDKTLFSARLDENVPKGSKVIFEL